MAAKKLWSKHYRPRTLDGYVFQNEQQQAQVTRMVQEGDLPPLLLTGGAGSGKTTLAEILINELGIDEVDVLRANASEKTGVDFIRDEVIPFASSYPAGKFRVVHLSEVDYLSPNSQGALRAVTEESSDNCRFICTCNYENKIIPAIKSRLQHLRFKAPTRDAVLVRLFEILTAENVEFDPVVVDKYVDQAYPDVRKIINNLQLNTLGGKLGQPTHDVDGNDYQFKLLDLIMAGNLREVRKLVSEQLTSEQVIEVYEFLWRNLEKHPRLAADRNLADQALVTLSEGEYRHGLTAIPHLNFEATCIKLFSACGE